MSRNPCDLRIKHYFLRGISLSTVERVDVLWPVDETFQLMIMTEFGLEKRRRLRDRYVSNSIEREQMIFEQILRTILDEDLTRYDVADWI